MNAKSIFIILTSIILCASCADVPDFDDVPLLRFDGLNKNTTAQVVPQKDTIIIKLYIEDADGDIGPKNNSDNTPTFFLKDLRDNQLFTNFRIPVIPPQGTGNGITAEIELKIISSTFDFCCKFPDGTACRKLDQFPIDSVFYDTWLVDRAGHESNHVIVGPIYIECND